jgi:hypothetical protein
LQEKCVDTSTHDKRSTKKNMQLGLTRLHLCGAH